VERGEGPFAAGIFYLETGQCIAAGVNCVLSSGFSLAHAEIMAILMAQRHTGHLDLSEGGPVVLTSSAQPCSQCMGAIPWTGISRLEYGADRATVEDIGFDEGPCPHDWIQQYGERGIQVEGPLLQEAAAEVLTAYARRNGVIY
jgi:tRNA(Arg) A34 adenosine deaminase TadA